MPFGNLEGDAKGCLRLQQVLSSSQCLNVNHLIFADKSPFVYLGAERIEDGESLADVAFIDNMILYALP